MLKDLCLMAYLSVCRSDFRPPTTYYTSIPLVSERASNRLWDAARLREFRKRVDSGTCYLEEIDQVASSLLDGEIVELASDWLGNTVSYSLISIRRSRVHLSHFRSCKNYSRNARSVHEPLCWSVWLLTWP